MNINKNDALDTLLGTLADYGNATLRYFPDTHYRYMDEKFTLSCKTGEDSGGNCWRGTATYHKVETPHEDFNMLDTLLLELEPDILMRDYQVIKALVRFDATRSSEYYGNGSYHDEVSISKQDLCEGLKKVGIVFDDAKWLALDNRFTELFVQATTPAQSINSKKKHM